MATAEKTLDYGLVPVIEVARTLFDQESGDRTTRDEKHFPNHGGLFVNNKKNRWYCHGESKGGDAIALIQFATGCDFKGALDWLRSQGFHSYLGERPAPRTPVESYDYVDAGGAVVYSVDRYKDPKSFRQWREIDRERVNGVSAGLYERSKFGGPWYAAKNGPRLNVETREFPAITPVPYRLPELLAARKEKGVLIAAGEKDVNNLRALHLTATCNHGGEGKWWPELTTHFKGRRVFILVDNDAAGEHHQQVVGSALTGVASEIRVVRFPELPEHGDVSDVIEILRKQRLDDDAVKQALYARLRQAPKWKATEVINAPPPIEKAPDEWPAPDMSILSHARLSPPRLPLEVFGAYWSKWISDQAEAKSCAPDYVAGGLISGAGTLIGNARWVSPWPGWEEPPVIWINNIGNPSSGKSPGLDVIRDVIGSIEADSNIGHQDNLSTWDTQKREAKFRLDVWESECKAALKDKVGVMPPKPKGAEEPPRPARKRIVTNDPTIEKVARLVLENPKGLMLFRDELSGWLGSLDKYGGAGGDRAFYLESYGGRPYAVDRMKDTEPTVVPSLSVVILGGMQPDRMVTLIFSGDDDGLAARFIYLWPERTELRRPLNPPPTGAKGKLANLYELEHRGEERTPLRFDEAAARALQDYRKQVAAAEAEAHGLYLSWLGKLPGMAVRLANIFEHLRWCGDREDENPPETISEVAATAAIAFLDGYAMPMARRCFGEAALAQVDIDARVLAQWIMANLTEGMTINSRSLRRDSVLSTKEAARYDAAIAELDAAGWLRSHPCRAGGGSGRKRKDFDVNPQLLGRIGNE